MAGEEEFGAANQTRYAGCAVRLVHPHFPGLIILQPNQHDAPMQKTLVRLTQDVRVPALLDQRRRLIISSVVGGSSVRLVPNPTGESDEHRKPPEAASHCRATSTGNTRCDLLALYMRSDSANISKK